ncbi:MAG: hypothetical protein M3404_07480 [Actinomycetota bacterium]|nr:hypothetical protein [Actinomycetota bacterium]
MPVQAQCKPGWGKGDKNHCHSGPPGRVGKPGKGKRPGAGDNQGLLVRMARNASSSEPLLRGGVALALLAGLVLPLPRRRRLPKG